MFVDYRMCSRCIMDTTDPDIEFDANGICNHCREYDEVARRKLFSGNEGERRVQEIANQIKEYGKNKEYNCVLGLSGGVDSSFVAYHAKRLGLRPLVVHFDNGWNSEISVKNIENVIRKLDLELYTYVIDWEEFKDLQLSFLKASVVDIEMITDHAITAAMFNLAKERGIKYILSGTNLVTEGIMPQSWVYAKWDIRNIRAIQSQFGTKKISEFPVCGLIDMLAMKYLRRYRYVEVLNYVDYNKKEAMEILDREIGWKYYGGKHYESVFTRFYQAYILPKKFKIDKRKPHLSILICSGQMTRDQALEEIKKPLYDPEELEEEKEYVLKKLGLTEQEFQEIMELPVKSHLDYPNGQWIHKLLVRLRRLVKGDR